MKTLRTFLLASSTLIAGVVTSDSQTIFSEDFESGLGAWVNSATPITISTLQNLVPAGGTQSALIASSGVGRAYHNLGTELSGASLASWYIYDDSQSRVYGEIRAYSGAGFGDGTLQNLYAAGKYNSVSLAGETYDATKYQARISATGFGWFNLNAAGAPSRSTGWHQFDIERLSDGTSYNFYVDGILGRSFTGVPDFSWDSVTIGSVGGGTTAGNAWVDGVSVQIVPEPSSLGILALAGFGYAAWRRRGF